MTAVMTISYDRVLAELHELIDPDPEQVYTRPNVVGVPNAPSCFYVHGFGPGETLRPGCVVGLWLHRFHGVPLQVLREYEGQGAREVFAGLQAADWLSAIDPRGERLLDHIQSKQDGAMPWGRALEEVVNRLD